MKLTRIMIVSKNTFAEIKEKYSIEMTEKELKAFNTNMKDSTLFVPMTRNDDEEICFIILPDNENDIFGYLNLTFYNMSKFMEDYNNQTSTIETNIEIKDGDNIMHKLSLLSPLFKVYFHTNNFCYGTLTKETLIKSIDDKKRFVDAECVIHKGSEVNRNKRSYPASEMDKAFRRLYCSGKFSKTIRENCPKIKYNFADCEIV